MNRGEVAALWNDFQEHGLMAAHLDDYRFLCARFAFYAGIRAMFHECQRIAKQSGGDPVPVRLYLTRCEQEAEDFYFKASRQIRDRAGRVQH